MPWGQVCGMHGGETSALAALKRGEIEERPNPTRNGPRKLYACYRLEGANWVIYSLV